MTNIHCLSWFLSPLYKMFEFLPYWHLSVNFFFYI
jgi:hypothetical protein